MKFTRLMVVLALSVSCVANRPASPSAAAETKRTLTADFVDTVISDRGTPIAGQQYCFIWLAEPTYLFPDGWHQCEGTKPLVWERHDRKTDQWVPDEVWP